MRTNLKVFRIKRHMSQQEFADELGYVRATYSAIECGKRNGRKSFWNELQKTFDVSDEEMWKLMQNDKD